MRGILEPLLPLASRLIVTRSHHERAADESTIFSLASQLARGIAIVDEPDLATALRMATAEADPADLVLVTGSLFLVGEALDWARRNAP
jgi:folylpolyglutamate synthase/dihydropteroate synthase